MDDYDFELDDYETWERNQLAADARADMEQEQSQRDTDALDRPDLA